MQDCQVTPLKGERTEVMAKVAVPSDSRPDALHNASFSLWPSNNKAFILNVAIAFATALLLSKQWYSSLEQKSTATLQPLSTIELEYGLAQCVRNQERPVVDIKRASTRLSARDKTSRRIVLLNATLVNGDGQVTTECNIEMQDGIFTDIWTGPRDASDLSAASDNEMIDLKGRVVTPGLIDAHSHAGVRETPQLWATEDVTEISAPVTPWGRAIDALKPHDQAIHVISSGGVTTSLVLTGAKNLISGEGVVVKMKRADSVRDMVVDTTGGGGKPQRYLKMAMGENQKRQFEHLPGGPATRIGESYWFRRAYESARRVKRQQDRWCEAASTAAGRRSLTEEYPRSLEWQTLVDVLRGDMRINVHGYETEDILAMFGHADEFGFNITALHHALHSDLITEEIKQRGIAVVGFSDSWGDKKELYKVSSYMPKTVGESGIPFAVTRDHPALHGQWLAYEAQIAHHFGLNASLAISSIISTPARLLGLDNRLGYVRPGFDADLVVWDRHPLRVGAVPLEVFIDGKVAVLASDALWTTSESTMPLQEAPISRPNVEVTSECKRGQSDLVVRGISKSFIDDDGFRSREVQQETNLTMVIRGSKVVCVGGAKCNAEISQAREDSVPFLDVHDGHILPGLTIVTRQHGLVEMLQEPSTGDGISRGNGYHNPPSSRFGIKFGGIHLERAHRAGVTRIVTPPLSQGFLHGISTLFRAGADSILDSGAIVAGSAALHFTIGHEGKTIDTPSITSQISKLHDLLTVDQHLHPDYKRAAEGELPILVHSNNKDVIAHMISLKRKTDAHIIILGGAEAHLVAEELADAEIPVIAAPFWGCEPLFWDARNCLPGPPLTDRLGPQLLMDKGVKVAISNFDNTNNHIRNSLWEAGWLAGPGNQSLALDLVSRNIVDILRLPESRDLVVFEGNPFEFGARVALIFEEGKVQRCYPDVDED